MALLGRLGGGGQRRLARAVSRAEAALAVSPLTGKSLDRAARDYGAALRLALDADPSLAARLFRDHDSRIPADRYGRAFGPADAAWLATVVARDDRHALSVAFELAVRLGRAELQREARDRLADLLGPERDADLLVSHLQRWQDLGLLEAATVTRALRGHLVKASLGRDTQLWSAFFDQLPEALLPELCEVHCFLGRGEDAVRLADTGARRLQALDCCARSPRLGDVRAGLELARRHPDAEAVRRLEEHAGDLLFSQGEYAEALTCFHRAARPDRVSECHERLRQFFEALLTCPADEPERLVRLVGLCQPEIDGLVERGEFADAARMAREVAGQLERAGLDVVEVAALRAAIAAEGRRQCESLLERAGTPAERRTVLTAWSRFEEESGELAQAARRAEEAADRYRAHRLFRRAGQFGEADRVLQGDDTPEGRAWRAEARESGGDLLGAAWLYAEAGTPENVEKAVELFMRAREFAAGADCLLRWRGAEALEDPRLAECLRRAGRIEELVRLCLENVLRADGRRARVVDQLRGLRHDPALSPELAAEARESGLDAVDGGARQAFEERAQAWVARARAETDRRFAGIWGLDLGTTTCAAAIYDSRTGQVVLCPWKGRSHFPSTLSLDRDDTELVGLAQEEIFADWLVGHIGDAKRAMGTRRTYRIRDRSYRPQEVAARLIRHARGLVEGFLAARVRERVGELAQAELGQVRDAWLSWAERHHDLRLDRPRAVLTIPAYFLNNQKHATRDACAIAGVEAVRLIHEPTAACLAAGRERGLTGSLAVVDLGAGTLDASDLHVWDGVYEVRRVFGDNHFGGRDFDAIISRALIARLERQGIDVPESGVARRRLEIAAEHLKVGLSAQENADYTLRGFAGGGEGRDVVLSLSRTELAEILAEPLRSLRRTCTTFKESLVERPEHLLLVGGPMLSPLVRETVEQAIGVKRTVVSDPRTVVASGAALQAAVLDGKLRETLLLDVTPLPLGIRVVDEERNESFSALIEANATIPTKSLKDYTTTEDNQAAVRIEVFNGQLDPASKIGQFLLEGIPPASAGVPQIEVTFSIDANCVLDVTAHDKGTGRTKSIRVTDSTLLSPGELGDMTRRYQRQSELAELRTRLKELADEAEANDDGEAAWRELRHRLSVYRPASAPVDPEVQRMLVEIFNTSGAVEVEALLVQEPVRNLTAKARAHLSRPPGTAAAEARAEAEEQDLTEARHLAAELGRLLDDLRPRLEKLATWNALLVRLATADPDPLQRFRNAHDSREYAGALAALRRLSGPLESREDIGRQLRCLAEVADADGYRETLTVHAGLLNVALLDPARPEPFLDRIRAALVTINGSAVGSGFLITDRLVVTNRHLLADETDPGRVTITTDHTATRTVDHIALPDSRHTDVALLRLTEPMDAAAATPLRLGHPKLLRIGDRVWAAGPPPRTLLPGVVNRFEEFTEQGLRLFKAGLQLPARCGGGPLLNDLGEAVGILTIRDGSTSDGGVFALTSDSLAPLLTSRGLTGP